MDITDNEDLGTSMFALSRKAVEFPEKPVLQDTVGPLLKELNKDNIRANLEKFTSFHTRYYNVRSSRSSYACHGVGC